MQRGLNAAKEVEEKRATAIEPRDWSTLARLRHILLVCLSFLNSFLSDMTTKRPVLIVSAQNLKKKNKLGISTRGFSFVLSLLDVSCEGVILDTYCKYINLQIYRFFYSPFWPHSIDMPVNISSNW